MNKKIRKNKKQAVVIAACALLAVCSVSALLSKQIKAVSSSSDSVLQSTSYTASETLKLSDNSKVKSDYSASGQVTDEVIVNNPGNTLKGHQLIAENNNYQMYFKEEALSIIIRDKKTGAVMESIVEEDDGKSNAAWQSFMKSGVVLQVLKGINIVPTTVDIRKAEKEVTLKEDGFLAKVSLKEYGIKFQLEVTLTEDGYTAEIPSDSIEETSEEYKIGEIYVYPFLGNTYLGERKGYMFIPDGNGALIYLENNEGRFSSNFSQYVYGMNAGLDEAYTLSLLWGEYQSVNEAEKIMAPVFGMVHTDSGMGYLGIIESGDYSAKIEAYPNGAYTDYNWICSKFVLRQIYTQPTGNKEGSVVTRQAKRNEFDIRIHYRFVSGEKADYTGLALSYREYLLNAGELVKKEDDFKIRLDFLGIDKENWLIFKRNVTMTTVDNIRSMYQDLRAEGVADIFTVYKGWQKGGINAVPVTSYKADGDIGGTKELTKLIRESKEQGIDIYLAQDALRINPALRNANFNIMKQITKRVYQENSYKDVFSSFRYLTPSRTAETLRTSAASYKKSEIKNLMLSGISNILFTYSNKGTVYSRVNTAGSYEAAVKELDTDFSLVLEKPFEFLWKYSDGINEMPAASSNYIFTDEEVPFLSIVFKGVLPMYSEYINFEANKQEFFLKLAEMGINPSFYITYEDPAGLQYTNSSDLYSSKYSVYKEYILSYYKELKEVHEKTEGAMITDHKQYANGLTVVTYDNGIKVYVNYSTTAAIQADGYEIEPMSFKVGEP